MLLISDPDQARHFVGPDLDLNLSQRLPADNTSQQIIKESDKIILVGFYKVLSLTSDLMYCSRTI